MSVTPAATPAPAPPAPPIERVLPLVGDIGAVDRFGYPTAFVDRVALQAMLREGRFAELTAALEAAQSRFEADWHHEYWPHDAVEAFKPDPTFGPLFDAWVAHAPTSFAPYAARGTWLCMLGLEARGGRLASDTTDEQFAAMHALHDRGVADLRHALHIRPRAIAVSRVLIVLGTRSNDVVDTEAVMRAAAPACPECVHIRVAYMIDLQPRWGGSYEEMEAFAAESMKNGNNARLGVLAGYVAYERASETNDPQQERLLLDEAIGHGEASDFYRSRAAVRTKLRDEGGALADLRKVVELRPAVALNHAALAVQLARLKNWRDAEQELRLAEALDDIGPVAGFRSQLVSAVRQQTADPRAPPELLDLSLAFERDPDRLMDLRRRRDGWTSLVVPVDEPVDWRQQPPEPAALARLLDDADLQKRSAAWCRLLERAIRASTNASRFRGVRCEIERVERAQAGDTQPLRLVVPRSATNGADAASLFIVAADGGLQAISLHGVDDDGIVTLRGAGDDARKAVVSTMTAGAGPGKRTVLLQLQVIDAVTVPPLRLALGGPQPAPGPGTDNQVTSANLIANAPLTWRWRAAKKAGASAAVEIVTRDKKPKVVATYTWDDATRHWTGPDGSKRERFRRLSSDGRVREDALDAWNRDFDPTATFNRAR